jgi:hypothetical protein
MMPQRLGPILFTPISVEWQFAQVRWKIAFPFTGLPATSAASVEPVTIPEAAVNRAAGLQH